MPSGMILGYFNASVTIGVLDFANEPRYVLKHVPLVPTAHPIDYALELLIKEI